MEGRPGRGTWFLIVLLFLLSSCATTPEPTRSAPALPPTATPGPVPTVTLRGLDGQEHALAEWQGQTLLVNYWATWCLPCRAEMPALAAVHERHPEVVVVGVNYLEAEETARAFVEELALPFPILLDEEAALAQPLGVLGLPTTFLITSEGLLVATHIGPLTEEDLERLLEQGG